MATTPELQAFLHACNCPQLDCAVHPYDQAPGLATEAPGDAAWLLASGLASIAGLIMVVVGLVIF